MKQNSRSIVGEVTKSTGVGFDKLNSAIESFGAGVADSMLAVVKQTGHMLPEHLDYFLDGFQTTAHGVVRPCIKETFGSTPVVIAPELHERFFDTPCSTGFEVELIQGAKCNRFGTATIGIGGKSRIFAARQRRHLTQTTVFLVTHFIDRLPEVFGNVE